MFLYVLFIYCRKTQIIIIIIIIIYYLFINFFAFTKLVQKITNM